MTKELHLLILNAKKGNQKAQIKLYEQFCEAMFFISCRYLKNHEEAKDAMQESFLKAFLNLESYTENYSFGSWIKKIVINTCIDVLKKKNLETVSIEKYPLQIIEDDDWNFPVKITKQQIEDAIELLKPKYQIVVKLYLMEGYDHEEISEILQIPIKTSRTHLRRGKLVLRTLLKTQNYGT